MDIRQIFIFLILICISNYTVLPLVRLSRAMNVPMNLVEPFLANVNSIYVILIILICWIVLISDYPKMEGNNGYILIRINRMTWLAGKICAFVLSAVVYIAELIIVFTLNAVSVCFAANGWSYLMLDFDTKYMDLTSQYAIVCKVNATLFNHYLPYQAFLKTVLLVFGICCMFGLIMIAASLGKSKMLGLIINLILTIGGFVMVLTMNGAIYLFPLANVMLEYQATALIQLRSKSYSWLYFVIVCAILIVCNVVLVRRGQIQKDGER